MGRVQDKVVIVTGAGRGIGEADVLLLAKEGAKVIATDIGAQASDSFKKHGIAYVQHDVRDESSWAALLDKVMTDYGRLDVLINNAGVIHLGDPVNFDLDEWRHMSSVNIEGTMLGCKYAIEAMGQSGGGSIVNLSSVAAKAGLYFYAGYCASKGAIAAYTKSVAVYCAQNKLNIRCNSVHPGGIDTPINAGMEAEFAEKSKTMATPPLFLSAEGSGMRMGEPNDIAYAVVYLASDESKFMSGSEIFVDNTATVTAGVVS